MYLEKGPTVIGFNCCGVPMYLYTMHVMHSINVILPGEVEY
jgi:hypothetical protein